MEHGTVRLYRLERGRYICMENIAHSDENNFWISRQNKYDIVNIFERILTMLFVLESFH